MKVSRVTTRILQTPADNPLVVGLPARATREFVTLEIDTDDGVAGRRHHVLRRALTPR